MRYIILIVVLIQFPAIYAQNTLARAEKLLENDSAEAAIEVIGSVDKFETKQLLQALKILGSAQLKVRDNQAAIVAYEKLLDYSSQYHKQQDQIEALYWLTRLNAVTGKFESAIKYGQQGKKMAELLNEETWEFRINNFLSWAYFEQQIDFNKVLLHEKRQAKLVGKIGNDTQKAQIYNNLGYDLTVAGIVHLDSTIALMSYANDVYAKNESHLGRWYTLMNLTWQHRLKGAYEKAIDYGKLSLQQAQKDDDRHAIIEASFQLGESLMAANKKEAAAPYYKLGLEQSLLQEDRDKFVFDVYYSRYLWETENKKEAVELVEQAVDFLTTSEVFYEMHGRALLAEYYYQLKNINQAQDQLDILTRPRHNYIALETKYFAAQTQAKIWRQNGRNEEADFLMSNWKEKLVAIGANLYVD